MRPDASAFVHREELFQLKHAAVVDHPAPTAETAAADRWVVATDEVGPDGRARAGQVARRREMATVVPVGPVASSTRPPWASVSVRTTASPSP